MKRYNFLTAFTMILGICIGSGIFFKVDDILLFTKGNVFYGILIFTVGASCCIFCGLTMGKMAKDFDTQKGITGFFEKCFGIKFSKGYDVFFSYLYLPSISIVIAWVSGIYTEMVLNLSPSVHQQLFIGILWLSFLLFLNLSFFKVGEKIQMITTIIKLLPLFLIAIIGVFFNSNNIHIQENVSILNNLPALLPIVFLYDGWSITTTISDKIDKPTTTMQTALSFTPILILVIYILFFVGITNIVSPDKIIGLGNQTIYYVGTQLFGESGAKILLIIVLISVLGALNGILIGVISSLKIAQDDKKTYKKLFILAFWIVIHYFVIKLKLIGNSDISEISVVFIYLVYAILFLRYFIKLIKNKNYLFSLIVLFAIIVNLLLVGISIYVSPLYTITFFIICSSVWLVVYFRG